ncbi:MAG: T9SS type A sorting domain-containing protein, partial [Muribaculaceae bacterium]|nr:T9SS type A sorting domain-containing protein [Muribaculaceae bacterium]
TVENCSSPATVNVVPLHAGIYLLRAVTDNVVKTARFVKN